MEKHVKITVKGNVQGVFFRKYTQEKALSVGVEGWVRNRSDGSVEIYAAGSPDEVDEFIAFCYVGSPEAVVRSVEVKPASGDESLSTFEIRPTA
jgi:acylphosphatase